MIDRGREASDGDLLKYQGDLDGARAAYQRAVDSGNPKAARHAAGLLAALAADTPPRSDLKSF